MNKETFSFVILVFMLLRKLCDNIGLNFKRKTSLMLKLFNNNAEQKPIWLTICQTLKNDGK